MRARSVVAKEHAWAEKVAPACGGGRGEAEGGWHAFLGVGGMLLRNDAPHSMFTLVPRAREMRRNPTPSEARLWQALRGRRLGVKFRRQHPLGSFVVDFYCASRRLVVEVDGSVHEGEAQQCYDAQRSESLKRGFHVRVLRLPAGLVMGDLAGAFARIREALG